MKLSIDVLTIISSIVSCYYWFRSAVVIVGPGSGKSQDVEIICRGDGTTKPIEVVGTMREQSRLNKLAALWAGLTSVLIALNLIVQISA